jgi:hypothetical protein
MGKKILFTTNQLALAMGLEVGKKYKNSDGDVFVCGMKDKDVCLYSGLGFGWQIYLFIDEELTEVKPQPQPQPQLTETEITILKGRLAEGCTKITRFGTISEDFISFDGEVAQKLSIDLFKSLNAGEEYSIEELLKGE